MDITKSSKPETELRPVLDKSLEIEELEKIAAPKLATNHNETFVRCR